MRKFNFVAGIILLLLLLPIMSYAKVFSLSEVHTSWVGEKTYDNAGISISSVGDVNGDGYDDILIGAHNNDETSNNAGKVYLVFGKTDGGQKKINLADADVSFVGEAEYDNAGIAVSYAGDVNADGLGDFLIGAPNNDERGENTGKAYLFFGKKGSWPKKLLLSNADVAILGERSGDSAGNAMSYAGDVNGDGYDDFLIGAKNSDEGGDNAGKCYLIFGKADNWPQKMKLSNASATFIGEDKDDKSADVLTFAGDVNGDGYDDFLIGASTNGSNGPESGKVYLILGRPDGFIQNLDLSRVDASFIGEAKGDRAGNAISFVGDINQDGLSDFLIGAESNNDKGKAAGKCYLFLGKRKGWQRNVPLKTADYFLYGEDSGDHFGSALSYAGDLDSLGQEGFAISSNRNDEASKNAGKIYFFQNFSFDEFRKIKAIEATHSFLGENKYEYAGNRLAYAGDMNGDGQPECLIGADSSNKNGRQAGQVYLIMGGQNKPPAKVSKISLKSDASYRRDLTTQVKSGDWIYLQAEGKDSQKGRPDLLEVIASTGPANAIKVPLLETEQSSGTYRGKFRVGDTSSNQLMKRLAVKPGETVAILLKNSLEPLATVSLQVSFDGYVIDDDNSGGSSGNNNNHLEAGETARLGIILANNYFQDLTGVTVQIKSDDKQITKLESRLEFGAIPSKKVQESKNKILLAVAPGCPSGHLLNFQLVIRSKEGLEWTDSFVLPIEEMIEVKGKIKDSVTNLSIGDGLVTVKGKKVAADVSNGRYLLTMAKKAEKDTLLISAPGHLSIKKEIDCLTNQNLDFSLVPRQALYAAPVTFEGENAYDSSGDQVSYAGDVNGDGYSDFLIGAWANDDAGSESGKVYLVFGRPGGWDKRFDLSRADASFIGETRYDEAGRGLSYAGDVNGDGFDDFLIGSPNNDAGGDKAGQVYLFFGKPNGWKLDTSLSRADISFVGAANHDRLGTAVSYAGDVNGDGYDDFLIGAWANDANGDDAGAAYLIFGKASGWKRRSPISEADASWVGMYPRDEAGKALGYAGDVNGDGYDDFLIGAPANSESKDYAGKSYLFLGKSYGWGWQRGLDEEADASFLGEDTNDSSGSCLRYVGDVNGDGLADFAVGAWASDANQADAGQVYLFFGRKDIWTPGQSLASADVSFIGEVGGSAAGLSFSAAGDVNGDGYDDFIIGAWRNKFKGVEAGQTYLISGKSGGWERQINLSFAAQSFLGKAGGAAAGRAVAYAGDVNGDGYDDFLIGAKGEDSKGLDAGETYLILSKPNNSPQLIENITATAKYDISDLKDPYQSLEVKLTGVDADPERVNVAEVMLTSTSWQNLLKLRLRENALNSGVYEGIVRVASTSSSFFGRRLLAHGTSKVSISAKGDGAVSHEIEVDDLLPPFVTRMIPVADETRAPTGGYFRFHVMDFGAGVDKNSVLLWVNDKQVEPDIEGNPKDHVVSYLPSEHFGFGQQVVIRMEVGDLSSPVHKLNFGYSFRTADAGVILNKGFEDNFKDWYHLDTPAAIIRIDNNIAHSGFNSCRIDFTGRQDINFNYLSQGPIPVQPDTDYLLTAFMKTEGINTMQGVRLYVEGSSSTGKVTTKDPGYFFEHSGQLWDTNDWTQLTVSFTTLQETFHVYVYVVRWTSGEQIYGRCWIDDLYLMDESEPGFKWRRIKGAFKEFFR